jgi:hypothetical protein
MANFMFSSGRTTLCSALSTFTHARRPPNPNVGMLRTNKKKGVFVSWKKKKGEQLRVVRDFFRNPPTAYPPHRHCFLFVCLFIY